MIMRIHSEMLEQYSYNKESTEMPEMLKQIYANMHKNPPRVYSNAQTCYWDSSIIILILKCENEGWEG